MTARAVPTPTASRRAFSRAACALGAVALLVAGCTRAPGVVRRPPEPARAGLLAADERRQAGELTEALAAYRRAAELKPADVRPHLRYVRALLQVGRRAEAQGYYGARAASPTATDAERTLAERLRTDGSSSALRRVYAAAADRSPDAPWWRLALVEVETAEADAWNRKRADAIERGDRDGEREALAQATAAVERGQRALERGARVDADLAEVHLYRGYLRAVEGDLAAAGAARTAAYGAAAEAFDLAVRTDGQLVEAWSGLGDARFRIGDLRESLVAYLEAVRLAPADATLRIALGVVLHEVDRLREAARQYREAAALRPWDADPLLRLGDALADARDYERALDAWREALRRDPEAVEGHYKLGGLLEHLGRLGEARLAYERYVAQGGPRAGTVQRRIDRLLRREAR